MLTVRDFINGKNRAKKSIMKGVTEMDLYNEILSILQDGKTTSTLFLDDFESEKEFDLMIEVVKEIRENNYGLESMINKVETDKNDLEIEIYLNVKQ